MLHQSLPALTRITRKSEVVMELGEIAEDPGLFGVINPDAGGDQVSYGRSALDPPGLRLVRGSRVRFERDQSDQDTAIIVKRSQAKRLAQ